MKFDLRRKRTLAGLGVTLAMTLPFSAAAGGPAVQAANARPASDTVDQLIIKYRNATTAAVLDTSTLSTASTAASSRNLGLKHVRRTALGSHVLRLNQRISVDEAQALAQEIQANDFNVEYAEPNRMMHALLTPNDTFYASQQWDLFEATAGINAPTAWDTTSGSGVVVAVIDTGYRPHADLAANIVPGYDFISDATNTHDNDGRDSDASDPGDYSAAGVCDSSSYSSSWHGTHVAGTIAAVTNNAAGIAGIAYGAKVQPVRVLGTCGGTYADIADAIVWASGGTVTGVDANPTPARVINMSLGGSGACSSTPTLQTAITSAINRGTVVVVAAGNSAANASGFSPASCTGVIAVAAVDRTGARASYSNFGSIVDLAAPGSGIYSTLNAGTTTPGADNYASYSGTSMATPHVAAVAALMLSVNSALTPADVESRLKSSARAFPVTCNQCGTGLLDASAAVAAATGAPTPPPPPPPPPPPSSSVAEVEPNNSRTAAQTITPNPATVTGTLSSSDASDYFAISLGAGKTLTATLTPPTSHDFDLYVYRSTTGSAVASSLLGTGAVDTATYINSTASAITVYVRARYYSGTGTGAYTLALSQ